MAELASTFAESANRRSYFYLRRIHSLLGIVPVGVFLCVHLTINATILLGGDKFQAAVDQLHLLDRMGLLIPIEFAVLFVPIFFHGIFGLVILLGGSINVVEHRYGGNVRYILQRATGIVALVFIVLHLWHMHWTGSWLGGGNFVPHDPAMGLSAPISAAAAMNQSLIWYLLYAGGMACAVYHFANGIWTALITWGITIGAKAQRGAGFACAAIGLGLAGIGMASLFGLYIYKPDANSQPQHAVVAHVADAAATDAAPDTTEETH